MQKILRCVFACFLYSSSFGQNLVANTGFEDRNICIEYQVKCAPEAWFFMPRYARMSPVERDSNHYELIMMGDPQKPFSVGNFLYTKLLCPLVAGTKYRIHLRVHTLGFEFDYLDFWLGETEPWRGRYSFSTVKPAFTIKADSLTGTNLKEWRELSYTFTAKGNERFLLLGNISQNPLTNGRKKAKRKDIIEYGIDDISLFSTDPNFVKCAEYDAIKDQVYRNDYRHPGKFVDDIEIDSTLITTYKKDSVVTDTVIKTYPPRTDTLIIPDVLFRFDKSDLNPKFIDRLDSFVTAIKARSFSKLLVAGHTDNVGTDEYNQKLSEDRANTIRNYLLEKLQINKNIIEAKGYGELQPRATNATAAGRQQNRRVEIILFLQ